MSGVLCVVYVSTASRQLINSFSKLCGTTLVHSFEDVPYNRTSFYLIHNSNSQSSSPQLEDVAMSLVREAITSIDYREHRGTHPSVGVVDHICFSPLGRESIANAANLAIRFSTAFHSSFGIPVYLYGAASPSGAKLADIRRSIGYFSKDFKVSAISSPPNLGHLPANPKYGVACIGVVPLVVNLNMKYRSGDDRAKVSMVGQSIREAGLVQCLTLDHDEGSLELACNLLDVKVRSVDDVLNAAARISAELGCELISHYTTGPSEQQLVDRYLS